MYDFSAYGPTLKKELNFTQTQVTLVGTFGNFGMYLGFGIGMLYHKAQVFNLKITLILDAYHCHHLLCDYWCWILTFWNRDYSIVSSCCNLLALYFLFPHRSRKLWTLHWDDGSKHEVLKYNISSYLEKEF